MSEMNEKLLFELDRPGRVGASLPDLDVQWHEVAVDVASDHVDRDAEAGGEPQDRAGVLRDIGLIEGDPHSCRFNPALIRLSRANGALDKGLV